MIPYNQPWRTSTMKNILRVSPEEQLFYPGPKSSSNNMMLRPDQKPVKWMMDVVLKFCKAEELIVSTCVEKLDTANDSFQVLQHRRLVRCEKDFT